ncbi:MAG: DUF998 domain-containing protein [Anaerolineae bacterium]|nr:DUF998 domain-containing protein [Anaerolineae bacterium]
MKHKPFTFAVAYWLVIIVIAHFFAPPGYAWTKNTISELASQGHTHKWIMQLGLSGFGALIMLAVGMAVYKTKKVLNLLLPVALYGLGVFLSGIYCAAPIDPTIEFSVREAQLHSLFATTAGLSLSAGILWHIFVSLNVRERLAHTIFLVVLVGFSMLFGLVENGIADFGLGIAQRLLYSSGFAWLIYQEFARPKMNPLNFQAE